ncbi:MAG: sulfatase [Desulfomonilia bacterium]|nr:sulfatase [Desulfomonilia bacterium]
MTKFRESIFSQPMTRRQALKIIGTTVGAGLVGMKFPGILSAGNRRPNVIFILTDDHRWDAFSGMDHPFLKTPHLDRIADEGLMFENSFCTTSLCSPSRASFLTGQYAHRHGVKTNHTPWQESNLTFIELLKDAGYDTAFIGKWHMPGEGLPAVRGLDHFITFTAQGGQGVYYDCPLYIDGTYTERTGRYITEDLTDFALQWIEKPRKNPFCLYLSHKAVHFGFVPPRHLDGMYKGIDLHLPPEADEFTPLTNYHLFVGAPAPLSFLYRRYCETVVGVDEQVGRILEKLDQLGMAEDTILVYTGDNGHLFGEHGLYDKRVAYEESIRIPFFIRYPKVMPDPGRRAWQMALNIDLAPTLVDLAGLDLPPGIQGQSLVPSIRSKDAPGRSSWLYEHYPVYPIPIPGIAAVRTDTHKYITYQNDLRQPELFDLASDPKEKHNLIKTQEGRDLLEMMKSELEAVKKQAGFVENWSTRT